MTDEWDACDTRELRLSALREALIAGERSGPSLPFDGEEFLVRKRAEYGGID